jgi:hypothetical protein
MPATDGLSPAASMYATRDGDLIVPTQSLLGCHSHWESANGLFSTLPGRVQARHILSREGIVHMGVNSLSWDDTSEVPETHLPL